MILKTSYQDPKYDTLYLKKKIKRNLLLVKAIWSSFKVV